MLRYNPSDFEELLIPETAPARRAPNEKAPLAPTDEQQTGFTLSGRAVPPFDEFQALYVNSKRLRDIWEARRGDLADGSASSYDLALANVLAAAGFTDQQIVDTCIAWRRKHGHDDPKKINRVDYWSKWVLARARERYGYPVAPEVEAEPLSSGAGADAGATTASKETRRTERRARDAARTEDVAAETDAAEDEWEEATADGGEAKLAEARRRALEAASKLLGVRIDRVERLNRDPRDYRIHVNRIVISVGRAGNFLAQPPFRAAVVDATEPPLLPRLLGKEDWQAVLRHLLRACQIVTPTQEETQQGLVSTWLANYLAQKKGLPRNSLKDAQKTEAPYYGTDKVLRIFSNDFWGYVATQPDRPTRGQVADGLRNLGGKQEPVNVYVEKRRTKKMVWLIPDPPSVEWDKTESE